MLVTIEGIYKGVKNISDGSFTDSSGNIVNYKAFYKLVFDQNFQGLPKECTLKISKDLALSISPNFKPYDHIDINLDINILSSSKIFCRVVSIKKK